MPNSPKSWREGACGGPIEAVSVPAHSSPPPVPETLHPAHQRVLDAAARKGVTLQVVTFPESTHTAEEAARAVGAELGQIVKSLVFVAPDDDGAAQPIVVLVGGVTRGAVARRAAVAGEPAIRRASAREADELTGFVIGGIPPIGHARSLRGIMEPDPGRLTPLWGAAGPPAGAPSGA